jgi:hypothetical protein
MSALLFASIFVNACAGERKVRKQRDREMQRGRHTDQIRAKAGRGKWKKLK